MGWNTTLVVYNDALAAIENDPQFGRKLADAVRELPARRHTGRTHVDVPAGNHVNAAMVVESHHADTTAIVTVAGNLGICQATVRGWNHHTPEGAENALRTWAGQLGFDLVRQSGR